jgi:uroporphyrinogen III methyltransferase/synthase
MTPPLANRLGRVYLVGAGPGDPGLITLRGVECLGRADLVLYDYLVNARLLSHVRPGAETVCLGRHGQDRILPQDEVNRRLVAAALAGRTVVRLKAGDPAVFARLAEELQALKAAGIPYEIVPGITAALAAGSHAGISLTQRRDASAVALVTGHEDDAKNGPSLDYGQLARFPGTLVFYMGVTTARRWAGELVAAGKPPQTPVAVVRHCSWPDQALLRSTLGCVADDLVARRVRPPAIIIVGEVAADADGRSWFTERPLFGKRVLVTRPADQAEELAGPLAELGADVRFQPAITIGPPADWEPLDRALAELDRFDWVVLSSANGARAFLDRLCRDGRDLRRLGGVRLAAIGPATAAELARWRLAADLTPEEEFRAEALADALVERDPGRRFLLVRASRGREVLAERLRACGAAVEQVVAYRSDDVAVADGAIRAQLADGKIDFVTVTSSAIARSLAALFGPLLHRARLVSISPVTSATIRELGFEPAAEASTYTMPGIVATITQAIVNERSTP